MHETWSPDEGGGSTKIVIGEPIPQQFVALPEPKYRPKLLLKTPSMRAMKNYYNVPIEGDHAYDNLSFMPESENNSEHRYDHPYSLSTNNISSVYNSNSAINDMFNKDYLSEYNSTAMSTIGTTISGGSDLNSERNEMGSTMKLVTNGMSSKTWFTHLCTIFCTISMACGLGNIYRLPQMALTKGGLPFLVSYIVLTVLIGLPLLFLELGIGQLAPEGFIKSWRAVPFFRGIGYVKLVAGCLLSLYYPLYMAMSLYYIIWMAKGQLPFQECATGVKITEAGYSADGGSGQQCLRKTFLKSPFEDPYWLGIYGGILFVIWIIITTLSIRKTKSYIKSLLILVFPFLACYVALIVKAVIVEDEQKNLWMFFENLDWSDLISANTWYFAAIQVFFSTNVGFGSFITNAGIMYNKVNPLWTALGYITINLIFGIGSVLMCHIFQENLNQTNIINITTDVTELHLMTLIYDVSRNTTDDNAKTWAIIIHLVILLAGFINMATITYTLLKSITVHNRYRLKWWQTSVILGFLGLFLGCAILLADDFQIVHLLDHYIVGNLILVSVIIEVFVFISFYGVAKLKSDFEFMLGQLLSKIWIALWWLMPLLLTGIFAWGLVTLPFEGIQDHTVDPEWLYLTGWSVVLAAVIFIFLFGIITVLRQDGYTLIDKLKVALESSPDWGPKDPIVRHNWIQWSSKTQIGERDFTLKRRGTRDYTRSVKRITKKAKANSDISASLSGAYSSNNDPNHNTIRANGGSTYAEPYYTSKPSIEQSTTIIRVNQEPLRITSLIDSLDPPASHVYDRSTFPGNKNPLARPINYEELQESSNSEGYGTFRKGPYIIGNEVEDAGHVCHRKHDDSQEIATEL